MSSRTARIIKEARSLLWPWCVVMIAATLPWLLGPSDRFTDFLLHIGFFAGIPLLASLSLGNEFRHRTLSLLLSQPVDRMKIWGEKLSVTIVATLSAALVFCFVGVLPRDREDWFGEGLWFIVTVGSATFWTLFSRSTIGGFSLTFIQSVFIVVSGLALRVRLAKSLASELIVSFAILCYSGVMLWLGRRKLAQFQVTGGIAGDDLLTAGPNMVPAALAGWLRCRPDGASLNLIRKELRLFRPLWLLTLLCIACLMFMVPVRFMPDSSGKLAWAGLAAALITPYVLLTTVFAVSLSLGQERTSGMQSWHMTLPLSARRQWFIKLAVAMLTSFVCAALVVTAGKLIFEQSFDYWLAQNIGRHAWLLLLVASSLVSFSAFWCACTMSGTVRAALLVFPAVGALGLASRFGNLLGELAGTGTLMDRVATGPAAVVWLVVPTLLLAVLQSARMFRTEPQDSIRCLIRNLTPLGIVAFLCAFSLRIFLTLRGAT